MYLLQMHIGDRVRQRMAAVGIVDQDELSRRVKEAGGSLSQAQVSQLLKGNTKRPRCLPELATVLQVSVAYLIQDETAGGPEIPAPEAQPEINAPLRKPIEAAAEPLLLYRATAGNSRSGLGEILVYREKVGEVSRPVELKYSRNAFAFTVIDDEAEPRFRRRETLIIDPAAPPAPDDDCLFVKDPAADPLEAVPLRLVRITPSHWIVRRFAEGSREKKLARSEWPAALRIFGSYARR